MNYITSWLFRFSRPKPSISEDFSRKYGWKSPSFSQITDWLFRVAIIYQNDSTKNVFLENFRKHSERAYSRLSIVRLPVIRKSPSSEWFIWRRENSLRNSHKSLSIIWTSIIRTSPYFECFFQSPGVFLCIIRTLSKTLIV